MRIHCRNHSRKNPIRILLATCWLTLAPAALAGDLTGFLPAAGTGNLAISYTDESYDEFYRGTEKVSTPGVLGEITTRSTSLWFNWGLTDRLALVVDAAVVNVDSDGTGGLEDSGPQNLTAQLAYRLWSRSDGATRHSLVGAVGVQTPLEGYVANAPVARGDNTTDGLLRLVYLLQHDSFYWSQQVGYDLRDGDAPDGVPIYTELGWSTGRLTWILWHSLYIADSGTDIGQPGFTFPSNQEEFQRLGAKAVARFGDRWSGFVGVFDTIDGRNSGDASGASIGLIFHF
jgi:hypothetical protein